MKLCALLLAVACVPLIGQKPAVVKKPIHGLTSMGVTGFNGPRHKPVVNDEAELFAHPGVYRGAVINVLWKDLEAKPGVYDFSQIDAAMKLIAKYNAKYPATPAVGKLRVWSGPHVPAWLIPLTGGPYMDGAKQGELALAGYWTPEYRKRWQALQAALAAKYDADPLMGEVASSSCSAATDESFIVPKGPEVQKQMRAHGFNDAAEKACLLGAIEDYDVWKLTPVDETFSPLALTDSKPFVRDDAFDLQVMKAWRAHFGERGVISNHSSQDPITDNLKPTFAQLKSVGPPIEIQTASQGVIQNGKETNGQPGKSRDPNLPPLMDWNKVIQNALDIGANEIEIWNTVEGGGMAKISYEQLKAWAAKMK